MACCYDWEILFLFIYFLFSNCHVIGVDILERTIDAFTIWFKCVAVNSRQLAVSRVVVCSFTNHKVSIIPGYHGQVTKFRFEFLLANKRIISFIQLNILDNNGKGRSALYLVRVPIDEKVAFDRHMRKSGYYVLHDTGELEFKLWVLKRWSPAEY